MIISQNNNKGTLLILLFFTLMLTAHCETKTDSASIFLDQAKQSASVEKQILLSKRALLHSQVIKDTLLMGDIYNFLGSAHQKIGDLENGIDYYLRAYELFNSTKNLSGLSNTLNNLGIIYGKTEYLNKAQDYFKEALQIKKQLFSGHPDSDDYKKYISGSYNNIGIIHELLNEYDSALFYFHKSFSIQKQLNDASALADSYTNIGIAYLNKNDINLAEENLLKAYLIADSINNIELAANSIYNLSEFYYLTGDLKKAEKFLENCYQKATQINMGDLMASVYDLKAKVSFQKNDYKNAFLYLSKFMQINDSLMNESSRSHIAQLQIIHEVKRKEEKITLLLKEKELDNQRIKYNRIFVFVLSGVLIFLIIFALIVFRQKKEITYTYKELVKRNLELLSIDKKQSGNKKQQQKYASSSLSDEKKQQTIVNLKQIIEDEKLYLEKELTIEVTAAKLNISRTYLSQVVNEAFSSNFTSLINKYRLNHAIELISDPSNSKYSIAGIAELSGFHSISSFNTLFKQKTGLTPSAFRQIAMEK